MDTETKNEKINQWLDTHIIKKVEASHISIILDELSYLITTLPKKLNSEFSNEIRPLQLFIDDAKKKYALNSKQVLSNESIQVANKQLKKNIKDRYVIGFLAYRSDNITLNQLRATYFYICIKLVALDNFNSRIETTLNETRLLQKKRRFIVQFLPDLNDFTNLNEFLTTLNAIKASNLYQQWMVSNPEGVRKFVFNVRAHLHKDEKEPEWTDEDLCNYRLSKHLNEFILPIENIVLQKSGITRNVESRVTKPKVVISNKYIDELTGDSSSLLSDTNLPPEEGQTEFTYEADERREDSKTAVHEVKLKKPISYHLDIVKANQQVNMRRRRSMMLLTDVQIAKDIEIKILFNELFAILFNINTDLTPDNQDTLELNQEELIATYLLVLLLTGNQKFVNNNDFKVSTFYFVMYFEFTPKRSKLNSEYDNLSDVKNEPFDILIPYVVGRLLDGYRKQINDIQNINNITKQTTAFLKKLNKKHSLHLTLNKVSNYLKQFLYHSDTDIAVTEILTLSEINHLSALPYYSITRGDIYYAQYHYYDHLNELLLNQHLNPDCRFKTPLKKEDLISIPDFPHVYKGEEKVGTKLSLEVERIKEQIVTPMLQRVELLQNKKNKNTAGFINFHNAFMDYLYILLGLSSGYRPVNETFGRLVDIDVNTGMFFISDKENRIHSQGRFIYLPDITRIQLKIYIDYLYLNMMFYKNNHNPLGHLLELIFESKTATITYLTVNESGKAEIVKNQNLNFIEERLSSYARLPLNWYRHHIRSLKYFEHSIYSPSLYGEKSISDEVISSWMGHADQLGFDYYDVYSGLSRKDQVQLAKKINDVLKSHGCKIVNLQS